MERKPESFRGTGKVPGRVLRKPGKTGGPKKFRDGLNILIFIYYEFPNCFGINKIDLISMDPLSLGRPKWGGSTWTKEAHVGEAPRRKLPPRGGSFLSLGKP